ncbi:secretin N-terminal domain-containing protein [Cerasicoccus fimbriatus]|uniref:secretin N-terminal domain-containing protein n=1 Tax=Cerasicoccus fimbriatus TaxID=3014554 RepID=UPI0022B32E82|nr:secretin N-terminal domain-containing protein [Cerasicoccus sp. TK19100]
MKTPKAITTIALITLSFVLMPHPADTAETKEIAEIDFGPSIDEGEQLVFGEDEVISIDYHNEDVRTIIREVADRYDLNLVIPNDLRGNTSIKLSNVTWRQVFSICLEPLGYTYIDDRNIVRIIKIADLSREPFITRVFLINYAEAGKMQDALLPMTDGSKGGRVQVDQRTNALLVTERPSRMNDIQAIIDRLDRPTPQVSIEAKLFELVTRERFDSDADESDAADSVIDDINEKGSAIYNPQAADELLRKLETVKGARLVTTMKVIALDEQDAGVQVTKRFPVPHFSYNEAKGAFVADGFEYQTVDANLMVRPEVNSAGFIRLRITPKLTTRIGETSFAGQGVAASLPLTSSKTFSTTMIVKDGFTLMLGGVGESINQHLVAPTPAGTSTAADQPPVEEIITSNFVIFVTAKTLNPDGTNYEDIADPRVLREMKITDSELPGYQIPEEQLELLNQIRDQRNESARQEAELEYREELEAGRSN